MYNDIMRIGIDCRMWNETGIGRYTRNIVTELAKLDSKNTYIVFLLADNYEAVKLPENFKKVKANIRWHTFSEQLILPIIYLRENLDLLFVPHFNVPILYFKKFIVTIHDLTILRVTTGRASTLPYPLYMLKKLGFILTMFFSVKKAAKIFAVTNYVKNDVVKVFKVASEKILLTPNAVSENFTGDDQAKTEEVLTKYAIKKPYLFYIGNAHPHKNVEGLIQAFKLVVNRMPNLTLVLGGNKAFFYERIEKELAEDSIHTKLNFAGFIDDKDLPFIYKGSEAFVNASFREGFGIQILEAFSCQTKVICSNTSSLPEIGGEYAYYFDPYNTQNIADVIVDALSDQSKDKILGGFKRVKEFSWAKSALTIYSTINDYSNNL